LLFRITIAIVLPMSEHLDGAARLQLWRQKKKLSQAAAARYLDVSQNTICLWETRQRKPRTLFALLLKRKIGIPIESWGNPDAAA